MSREHPLPASMPLTGRRTELAELRRCFERARRGKGQSVVVTGDGGLGKSRLLEALREDLADQEHTWWLCQGSPDFKDSTFHPLVGLVARLFGIEAGAPPEVRLAALERGLDAAGRASPQSAACLGRFLGLPGEDPRVSHGGRQKEQMLELLLALFDHAAAEQTLVFGVEDVEWLDPSTRDFLELVVHTAPAKRLLAVFTSHLPRPPAWLTPSLHLHLDRLSDAQAAAMAQELAGGKTLPDEVLQALVEKAHGVPFFLHELVTEVLSSDLLRETATGFELVAPLPELSLPATPEDSLLPRLDLGDDVRRVAEAASVLGHGFRRDVLERLLSLPASELEGHLGRLVEAEVLEKKENGVYVFRHALFHDAVYASLAEDAARELHRQAARALLAPEAEVAAAPERVARHLSAGGCWDEASEHWFQAARQALERCGNLEAIADLDRALGALGRLPPGEERDRREVTLLTVLGTAWAATQGFSSPEAEDAYQRAYHVAREASEPKEQAWILSGLWMSAFSRSDFDRAHDLGLHMLELAEAQGDPDTELMARYSLASTLFYRGRFAESLEHLERGLALETTDHDPRTNLLVLADQRVSAHGLAALALWIRGFSEQADEHLRQALERARRLAQPFSLCFALSFGVWLAIFRRQRDELRRLASELFALANEQGFFLAEWGEFFLDMADGDAASRSPEHSPPLTLRERQRETKTGLGLTLGQTAIFCLVASRSLTKGKLVEAQNALLLGRNAVHNTGEHYFEAEIARLRGELALARSEEAEVGERDRLADGAARAFAQALEIARNQEAAAFELRAALALARLWRRRGGKGEARDLLRGVRDRFTEGLDTPDLRELETELQALS